MTRSVLSGQRSVLLSSAIVVLGLSVSVLSLPAAPQDRSGRPGVSIEAAKAPAVAARRAKLMDVHKNGIIIVASQSNSRGGLQNNPNFTYLAGLKEPEAVLVLDPGGAPREVIYHRMPGAPGQRGSTGVGSGMAAADQGIIERPIDQLVPSLRGLAFTGRAKHVFLPFSDLDLVSRTFGPSIPHPFSQSEALFNVDPTLAEMRLTKDAGEIAALREAIDLTAEALHEAFRAAEPKMREIDLAAVIRYYFDKRDTEASFLQAASGPNATNIHFGATERPLGSGDLVVFDVGAWIRGYTSDISRTIPASGRFTREQRAIYGLVLEAEKLGCARLVPGVTFKAVQTEVEDVLMAGLEKLGLVTDVKSPWQRRLYIQHGFGHGIGLDVHDSWSWHSPRLDKVTMAPGMVMTMEPGLYFPEVRLDAFMDGLKGKAPDEEIAAFRATVGPVYRKYAGIGVRIEDDVLITAGPGEILSGGVPKEIAEVERLVRETSPFNKIK